MYKTKIILVPRRKSSSSGPPLKKSTPFFTQFHFIYYSKAREAPLRLRTFSVCGFSSFDKSDFTPEAIVLLFVFGLFLDSTYLCANFISSNQLSPPEFRPVIIIHFTLNWFWLNYSPIQPTSYWRGVRRGCGLAAKIRNAQFNVGPRGKSGTGQEAASILHPMWVWVKEAPYFCVLLLVEFYLMLSNDIFLQRMSNYMYMTPTSQQ